jgi:predicted NBD/HSP70 family sugar kinase
MKNDFFFRLTNLLPEEKQIIALMVNLAEPKRENLIDASPWGITKTEKILGDLRQQGIVLTDSSENEGAGRKPYIYKLNKRCGFFLGIEMNTAFDRLVLTDWNGTPFSHKEFPPSFGEEGGEKILASLNSHIKDFIGTRNLKILALTLAPYYFIDPEKGCVHIPMKGKKRHPLPIRKRLAEAMEIPIYLSWPKVAICYKSFRHTLMREKKTFININIEYGVGMSLFIGGKRYGGFSGIAGDFGHMVIPGNKRICYCGNRGCLRTILSFKGICELAQELEARNRENGIESSIEDALLRGPDYKAGVDHLIALAKDNEKTAMKMLHDIGVNLGMALSIVVSTFNPEYLIINSDLTTAGEVFTGAVLFTLKRNTRAAFIEPLKIEFRLLENFDVAEGAAVEGMYRYIQDHFTEA